MNKLKKKQQKNILNKNKNRKQNKKNQTKTKKTKQDISIFGSKVALQLIPCISSSRRLVSLCVM
jgi:hypothetical protein